MTRLARIVIPTKNSLLNIKGVSCAAINAGIKHAQNSSANSKIEDAEKLDLSIVSFVPETTTAAVFTQNVFCAAPVVVAKNHLNNHVRALVPISLKVWQYYL
jgi:glutamate N-acetyltransferase/amino-acid N-acetyltransferase